MREVAIGGSSALSIAAIRNPYKSASDHDNAVSPLVVAEEKPVPLRLL